MMKQIIKRSVAALLLLGMLGGATACGGTKKLEISWFSRPTVEKFEGQKKSWEDVSSFICYYGDFVEEQKNFDVAIMHSNTLFTNGESAKDSVKALQDVGTYVISYITVGEDDSLNVGDGLGEGGYASYYIYEQGFPKQNTNWGSYFVDAGNPVWQAKIIEKAGEILSYGVDGLFLDTLDTVDIAPETMGGMASLVKLLKETYPEAKLIANRGFSALQYISPYIDGLMFESFNTTYNFEQGKVVDIEPEDVEYNENIACNVINKIRKYDYFPVFALDYVNEYEYDYMPQQYYNRSWQYDFIPYCTYDIQLSIACNPNIAPTSKRGELAFSYEGSSSLSGYNGDMSAANLAYCENGVTVTVDSTYGGYSLTPLNDGWYATAENHNQKNWASESWASTDNKSADHWICFEFAETKSVGTVHVYWGNDNDTFYSPQECIIQAYIDGEWVEVAKFTNEPEVEDGDYKAFLNDTVFEFENVMTTKIRVLQPKNKGCADKYGDAIRSGIMWVSEVEIYG